MNWKITQSTALALTFVASCLSLTGKELPAKKPNIVIILADDMGYSDLGCVGGDIQTPNLDKLAKDGLLFPNFYNNAKCAPTRASLMTGVSNHKTGADHGSGNVIDYGGLSIAEALEGEYVNLMIDKWHITPKPMDLGFSRYFGSPLSAIFYWPTEDKKKDAGKMRIDDRQYTVEDMEVPLEEWYLTTEDTRYANRFIEEEIIQKKSDKPFFMYYGSHAPHWPLQALEEDVQLYLDVFKNGTDDVRQKRYQYMIKNGIFDAESCKLEPAVNAWKDLSPERKKYYQRALAVHYAMVHRMDVELGHFFDYLKKNDLWDNTLIFFMSDNGASGEGSETMIPKGGKLGARGTRARIDGIGAQMCNTPFRGNKSTLNEGGVATPMIAHWPAGFGKPGKINRQVGHIIDLMPTILDITGIEYPETYKGRKILDLDGVSLLPALLEDKEFERSFVQYYEGHENIHDGEWKLYRKNKKQPNAPKSPWQLYNLKSDRTQQNDLAAKFPERVAELEKKYQNWEKEVAAIQAEVYKKHPKYSPEEKYKSKLAKGKIKNKKPKK
ncbi:arylsulfatase (aryl-sulfate sulphohydrolase) [Lentisphaera araneosa HTCC2155]|uniref:Arylsulfatase (Aryl-sulfate sulphohydrolase) n=1 Tax=Lentisphaera araneosa HTCC2155 TaxID=313628 RepID=A6DJ58_9BACT|nr:sulfatase-like hydrolase/transferase [Lentisphaera araneosa]EDM28494.1 arylsulfatase (aryl-sulfate sulphohydrolase) [Lentisphaera araneosa HTCC2155]